MYLVNHKFIISIFVILCLHKCIIEMPEISYAIIAEKLMHPPEQKQYSNSLSCNSN